MFKRNFIDEIEIKAKEIGFDEIGITDLEDFTFFSSKLKNFIKNKYHGEMDWIEEKFSIRKDPKNIWKEAKSAIVLGINYAPSENPLSDLLKSDRAYISVYSRRKDYHKVIKSKLKELARYLQTKKKFNLKVFVDTAPLMEKPLASAAGIGSFGKHTNIVSKNFGSWLFLGVILTNISFYNKKELKHHCGSCSKCLDICPTQAINKPFTLNASKCISYLTIEHKGHINRKFRKKIGNRIFGCDDCLAVCPWNKFAKKYKDTKLEFIDKLKMPKLIKLVNFSEEKYKEYFRGTPIKRLGYNRFMRNILIAVANSKQKIFINEVKKKLNSKNELIRAMAVWAILSLDKNEFSCEKNKRFSFEKSPFVIEEWMNG